MNEEEKYKKSKLGKIDKTKNKTQTKEVKVSSGERLSQNKEMDTIKITNNNLKKQKKKFPSKKRKSIGMFLVLFIFMSLSTICLSISNFFYRSQTKDLFDNNKKLSLAIFTLMLIGSFIFSIFVSYCECLIKTHFLGIIFCLSLNVALDYCILYKYFLFVIF